MAQSVELENINKLWQCWWCFMKSDTEFDEETTPFQHIVIHCSTMYYIYNDN